MSAAGSSNLAIPNLMRGKVGSRSSSCFLEKLEHVRLFGEVYVLRAEIVITFFLS
jgi:hypothetical protein